MEATALTKFGLTEGESKVYLALLRLGQSAVGAIIKEARVSSSKVYDILDRLSKMGLVGSVVINNVKHFEAKEPSRLREFVEIKERELAEQKSELGKLVPQLEAVQKYAEPAQEAEILQGIQGIKTSLEIMLKRLESGDTLYVLGIPKEGNEILEPYLRDYHKRRVKKKVRCKMLYNQDAMKWAVRRARLPLTEVRFLPRNICTPATIDIGKDYVATLIFGERPLCIVVRNKRLAESYRIYFELLWKTASK